jgi:AbrB family looped-hinge helix DNA binding protein
MSSKGQIVIPAELRERYGFSTGDEFVLVDIAGRISLHPVPDDPIAAARGAFRDIGLSTDEFVAERRRERDRENEEADRWHRK